MRRGPRGSTTRTHFIKALARWLGLADRLLLEPNSIHQVSAPSRSRGLLHCDTFQICMPTLLVVQKLGKSRWLGTAYPGTIQSCCHWLHRVRRRHLVAHGADPALEIIVADRGVLLRLCRQLSIDSSLWQAGSSCGHQTCAHKQFPRAGRDCGDASTLDLRLNGP
jgi:hypothetical protein